MRESAFLAAKMAEFPITVPCRSLTGCGKTHLARTLAQILDVPFHVADATEFTEAGYYGKDVEVMIAELLEVLTGPPDAVVREVKEILAADGVEVAFTEGALREIVRSAVERRAGARGLRAIVEEVVADLLFEAPERSGTRAAVDSAFARRRLERMDPAIVPEP